MNFNYRHCRNETEVRSKLVVYYLLPKLGYSPDEWYEEATFRNIRLDFFIANKPKIENNNQSNLNRSLIIETKHPQQNLDVHVSKFNTYLSEVSVRYGADCLTQVAESIEMSGERRKGRVFMGS